MSNGEKMRSSSRNRSTIIPVERRMTTVTDDDVDDDNDSGLLNKKYFNGLNYFSH